VQRAQVDARRADVSRAEVNLADARLDYSRKEQLVERGFISPAERDKSRAVMRAIEQDLASAQAQLEVAAAQVRNAEASAKQREAALAAARINLERTVIRARSTAS
jgi:HlyD family secretion protein